MAKGYFFNVGHGEAILIKYPNLRIIRDFGRSPFAKDTAFSCHIEKLAYHWVTNRTLYANDNITDIAILSHLHEDHFNGFIELHKNYNQKFFKKAFIPWLSFDELNAVGGFILQINLFLARFYCNTPYQNNNQYKKTLKIIPVLFDLSEELYCVRAGHTFNEIPDKNNVYWPSLNSNEVDSKDLDDFNDIINSCLHERNVGAFKEDSQQLLERIKFLIDNKSINHNPQNTIDFIDFISEKVLDKRPTQKESERLRDMSSKYIDNNSIIFAIEDKALFLSDADDKCVSDALNGITACEYKYIKAGHHGNRGARALNALNFKSDEVICCCGPAHRKWWGPSVDYLTIGKNYCTDWNDNSDRWSNKNLFMFEKKSVISRNL